MVPPNSLACKVEEGQMRGRIKFEKSDEEWLYDMWDGELVFLTSEGNGTIWRITKHPTKPSLFQIHYDDNCYYETNIWSRKAMNIEFSEKYDDDWYEEGYTWGRNDVLKASHIDILDSIDMMEKKFLWTF